VISEVAATTTSSSTSFVVPVSVASAFMRSTLAAAAASTVGRASASVAAFRTGCADRDRPEHDRLVTADDLGVDLGHAAPKDGGDARLQAGIDRQTLEHLAQAR
jgi:hypothetical protein